MSPFEVFSKQANAFCTVIWNTHTHALLNDKSWHIHCIYVYNGQLFLHILFVLSRFVVLHCKITNKHSPTDTKHINKHIHTHRHFPLSHTYTRTIHQFVYIHVYFLGYFKLGGSSNWGKFLNHKTMKLISRTVNWS